MDMQQSHHNRPALERPADFEDFWAATLTELACAPAALRTIATEPPQDGLLLQRFSLQSLGGLRISAYLLSHTDGQQRPLVVHSHGYGSRCTVQYAWARQGLHIAGFDVRGCGASAAPPRGLHPGGMVLTGLGRPGSSILRGAVCDYLRVHEGARALLGDAAGPSVFKGRSFSGALALMAAALDARPTLLVAAVPTFGWFTGRRRMMLLGSGGELNRYLDRHPRREAALRASLRYFDPMHFAPELHCPVVMGIGREDPVVPAVTVRAIAAHIATPLEVHELPCSHTQRPEEALWDDFDALWLRRAAQLGAAIPA